MNKLCLIYTLLFLLILSENQAQITTPSFKSITKTSPDGKYTYEEVENDPTQFEVRVRGVPHFVDDIGHAPDATKP